MKNWIKLQRALEFARRNSGTKTTLRDLAARTGQPLAAVLLVSSPASILDIALACGFDSHEAFCRAFQRRFR